MPAAARSWLLLRATQQAIPSASKAAPAIRIRAIPEGEPVGDPSRRMAPIAGNSAKPEPASTSTIDLAVNSVFIGASPEARTPILSRWTGCPCCSLLNNMSPRSIYESILWVPKGSEVGPIQGRWKATERTLVGSIPLSPPISTSLKP